MQVNSVSAILDVSPKKLVLVCALVSLGIIGLGILEVNQISKINLNKPINQKSAVNNQAEPATINYDSEIRSLTSYKTGLSYTKPDGVVIDIPEPIRMSIAKSAESKVNSSTGKDINPKKYGTLSSFSKDGGNNSTPKEDVVFNIPLAERTFSAGIGYGVELKDGGLNAGESLSVEPNSPVFAVSDGVIKIAGDSSSPYGQCIRLACSNGYTIIYTDIGTFKVNEGDMVQSGTVIGYTGNLHLLHFEIRDSSNKAINPEYFKYGVN